MSLPEVDSLWDYADPVASEQRFREVMAEARTAGEVAVLVEVQSQIARALCLQRRFDEAHAMLDEAETWLTD